MIRVLICAYSSSELLNIQIRSIRKYIPEARIYVINDKSRKDLSGIISRFRINRMISSLGVEKIEFSQKLHRKRRTIYPASEIAKSKNPSLRHADVLQVGMSQLVSESSGPILILDEDMIPFRRPKFLVNRMAEVFIVSQGRPLGSPEIFYPWPGLFFFNPEKTLHNSLMSWDAIRIDGLQLDTGGAMNLWLEHNRLLSTEFAQFLTLTWSSVENHQLPAQFKDFLKIDLEVGNGKQYCEIYDESFLHMRGSSNWMRMKSDVANRRLKEFIKAFKQLIAEGQD